MDKELLSDLIDYARDLKGEWIWKKNEPRNGNAQEYAELEDCIRRAEEILKFKT
jgi:hypothetical protein